MQKLEFSVRQHHFVSAGVNPMLLGVQPQTIDDQFPLLPGGDSAQYCLNTGNKLHHAKRFGNVIIGSHIQAFDFIVFSAFGRKHNYSNILCFRVFLYEDVPKWSSRLPLEA